MIDSNTPIKIEISHKTVIFTIAFLISLWFVIQIKEIIIVIFLSLIVLSALHKPVDWFTRHKIPRVLSVIIVYIIMIATITIGIGLVIPPLVEQSNEFGKVLPQIISTINDFFVFNEIPVEDISTIIARQIQQLAGDFINVFSKLFSRVLLTFTVFILSFYFLLDWDKFVRLIASPFSGKNETKAINLIAKIETGLGHWLRGQVALSIIVGLMVYIGLTLLGMPFAIPLAVIAALLEIIPIIGPTIAAIPAILVALTFSPFLSLAIVALYIIIQQIESNIFQPVIMSKVTGIHPPAIIIGLLIGSKLSGVAGAILAVPFIVLFKIIASELFNEDKKKVEDIDKI